MTLVFWYWLILVVLFIFGFLWNGAVQNWAWNRAFYAGFGWSVFVWILFIILGYGVFHEGPLDALIKK